MIFLTLNNITELGKITLHKLNHDHFQVMGVSVDIIKTSSQKKNHSCLQIIPKKTRKPTNEALFGAVGITQLSS